MKKTNFKTLAVMLFLSLFVVSCNKQKDPDLDCQYSKEFSNGTFSVYYVGTSRDVYKGDIKFSADLSSWVFSSFSDPSNVTPESPFMYSLGSLSRTNYESCEEKKYTFHYYFTNGSTNTYDLLVFKRTVDPTFDTVSYLFETNDPATGQKIYYRFYKK